MRSKAFVLFGVLALACSVSLGCDDEEDECSCADTGGCDMTSDTTPEVTCDEGGITEEESTLEVVVARGTLNCGVSTGLFGFSYQDDDDVWQGFDADYCRAVAVAVLGDPDAVNFVPLTAAERFEALQDGTIDVLVRNTTWTIGRDTSLELDFAPTTFYDGQGFLVPVASTITELDDLEGLTICVQDGTTTQQNLADVLGAAGVTYTENTVADDSEATSEYTAGNCGAITSDKSGLAGMRLNLTTPADHVIMDITISKEPLAPAVRHGDNNWGDIVSWVVNCTFAAEEYGVDSDNVDDMLDSEVAEVKRMLGVEGELGAALGLSNDFCYDVIKALGNYEEIYNRYLGPDTDLDIPRGPNTVWINGGLLYSPPFR